MSLEIFILQVFACMSVSDVDLNGRAIWSWVLEKGLEPPEKDLLRGYCQVLPSSLPVSLSLGVSTSHIPSGVQYSKSSPMGAAGVLWGEGRWLQKSAVRLQRSVGNARLRVWLDFVL